MPSELGHVPDPGAAVRVADARAPEGQIHLFATPSQDGGYCMSVSAPWYSADMVGRGYCVKKSDAIGPLVAGIVGEGPEDSNGMSTSILAGRVQLPNARSIALTDPDGETIERPLGPGGFFAATVRGRKASCFEGKRWWPNLIIRGDADRELARATFPLWTPGTDTSGAPLPVCSSLTPTSDVQAARLMEP